MTPALPKEDCSYEPYAGHYPGALSAECRFFEWIEEACEACEENRGPCPWHGWPPEAVKRVKFGEEPEGVCTCTLCESPEREKEEEDG